MSELSKSNNPRVRRAYAHAMLHKLANGEVGKEVAEEAISRADQTSKGRASNFTSRLLEADRKGRFRTRPTANCDIEIFIPVRGPDGKVDPALSVAAAGSGEDFDKALEEGEEFAASDRAKDSGLSPSVLAANYTIVRLAEMHGLLPQLLFIKGAQLASSIRDEQALD